MADPEMFGGGGATEEISGSNPKYIPGRYFHWKFPEV